MKSIELSRLALQDSLDVLKTQQERNILGQFATPHALASDILRHALFLMPSCAKVDFLDPAIGTGSFYAALRSHFQPDNVIRARGFEVDPHYGLPAMHLWNETSLELQIKDFTVCPPPAVDDRANLIICNPPYVRHHHLDLHAKSRLAEAAARYSGIEIGGLAGLYCYFMAIAHAWLAEGGLAGWLIPSEFMDVNYGSAVRKYLTEKVDLVQIHRFDPKELQFGDAQVSSAVVWFRKRTPSPLQTAKMTFGGTLADPLVYRQIPIQELRKSSKWSSLVHGPAKVRPSGHKWSDLFSIKRGLATGDNKFFILTEEKAHRLLVPEQFLRPVLPSPRHLVSDVVEADELGRPSLAQRLYLLDCPLNEEEVSRISAPLAEYLSGGRDKAAQTYICSRRTPWYSQEKRPAAPFVCTYMGRGLQDRPKPFRFILNKSNATALNVYLMLYPRPLLASAMQSDGKVAIAVWEMLNAIPSEVLLGEGRVYGGGLYKMEPKELANVPADGIMALLPKTGSESMVQGEMFSELVA
jgi:adenine-specific DNA-methyltransferase